MNIKFMPIKDEIEMFKNDVKRVLSTVVIETFGSREGCLNSEDVISDVDIDSVLE